MGEAIPLRDPLAKGGLTSYDRQCWDSCGRSRKCLSGWFTLQGQESERCVSGYLFHEMAHRVAALEQWAWRYYAYLVAIFAGVFLLVAECLLLLSFLTLGWVRYWYLWLWAFWPAVHLGLPALSAFQMLEGFGMLCALLVMPPLGLLLIREGRVQIALWSADPNGQAMKLLQRQRAELAYLRVLAEQENDIDHSWRHLWRGTLLPDDANTKALRKYAGPVSFAYVTLSTYLGIPPASLNYGDEPVSAAPAQEIASTALPQEETQHSDAPETPCSPYQVFFFGQARMRVVGKKCAEISIKSWRQRALLAYLGLIAREKETQWEHLANSIYEEDFKEGNNQRLQESLYSDVKALRKLVRDACSQARIPYIDPIEVTGRGRGARYRLAEAYEIVDLARFDHLVERMDQIKQASPMTEDVWGLRAEYQAVLTAYANGLLGQQIRENRIGKWANSYYHDYRNKYHRLLHDLAEYEYRVSATQQGEERKASLWQAVKLYEECALQTAPTQQPERKEGQVSEHALRQCFLIYGELRDLAEVQHLKSHYFRTMKRRFSDWEPEPETEKVFEAVTQAKERDIYIIKIEEFPPQQN